MRESTNATIIHSLADQVRVGIGAAVPSGPVALIGFPAHTNVGDSAIWQGQQIVLRQRGLHVSYVADLIGFDARALRRHLPSGTVLLHGGGNLGDLWPDHHLLRRRVIEELPDYPIVQLPQTSHFVSSDVRSQTKSLFLGHSDLQVLCRDHETLKEMLDLNGGRAALVPDSAFALGCMSPTAPATRTLWLARQDAEAVSRLQGVDPVDWIDASAGATRDPMYAWVLRLLIKSEAKIQTRGHRAGVDIIPNSLTARVFDWLAERRLRAGLDLLAGAKVLITDRLHAHLLALLLDVPHVLVDTGYGKISRFRDTWTRGAANVRFTTDASRVSSLVAELEKGGDSLTQDDNGFVEAPSRER